MTIEERKVQLTRIIHKFLEIAPSFQEMLNKTLETVAQCEHDDALITEQKRIMEFIDAEMQQKQTNDVFWPPSVTVASSSSFTELDQLEQDLEQFQDLSNPGFFGRLFSFTRKPQRRFDSAKEPTEETSTSTARIPDKNAPVSRRRKRNKAPVKISKAVSNIAPVSDNTLEVDELSRLTGQFQKHRDEKAGFDKQFKDLVTHIENNDIQNDHIIKPLLKSFRARAEEALKLILSTQTKLSELQKDNNAAISLLKDSNEKLISLVCQKLYQDLSDLDIRTRLLTPFETSNEQDISLAVQDIHQALKTQLQGFLAKFMLIKFDADTPPETRDLKKPLLKFIDKLCAALKNDALILDRAGVDQLKESMKNHLKASTSQSESALTDYTEIMERLSIGNVPQTEYVTSFAGRFSDEWAESRRISTLKTRFTSVHHAISTIQSFAIDPVKNHSMYLQTYDCNAASIKADHARLEQGIADEKASLTHLKFLCYEHNKIGLQPNEKEEYEETQRLNGDLDKLQKTLNEDNTQFELDMEALSEADAIKRLVARTDLQMQRQKTLTLRAVALSELSEKVTTLKKELKSSYNLSVSSLKTRLETILKSTDAALAAAKETHSASMQQSILDCKNLLANSTVNTITSVPALLDSIPSLRLSVEALESSLQQVIRRCKDTILAEFKNRLDDIDRIGRGNPPLRSVSELNPFKDACEAAEIQATQQKTRMDNQIAELDISNGTQLAQWKANFDLILRSTNAAITIRNEVRASVREIERRLHDPYYKLASARIKPAIEAEIQRIANKYRRGVDPRITVLQNMISRISALENDYISQNLDAINTGLPYATTQQPEQRFKARLKLLVGEIFHRSNTGHDLETLSEYKRSAFATWFRVHIIKPLQSLFGPTPQAHRFFATKGATSYERNVINIGNRALDDLDKPAGNLDQELHADQENRRPNPAPRLLHK